MRVLGIDPGMADTGWAVVEPCPSKGTPKLVASGLVKTAPSTPLPKRLHEIHAQITEVCVQHKPQAIAIEEMFFMKAAHTVRATLQARGVILLAASQSQVPVTEYNPRHVKTGMTGSGAALKPQMQKMVQRALSLEAPLHPDDVADAAAIALCHLRAARGAGVRVLERIGGKR
ncbi:MAG: crossover junction endodeoxyribonuclease RuvC [Elusimicrobia bacterium]|nr:crossover junction endodeoxyribonuclease RuvC [Elusimicrobiota bacterium]